MALLFCLFAGSLAGTGDTFLACGVVVAGPGFVDAGSGFFSGLTLPPPRAATGSFASVLLEYWATVLVGLDCLAYYVTAVAVFDFDACTGVVVYFLDAATAAGCLFGSGEFCFEVSFGGCFTGGGGDFFSVGFEIGGDCLSAALLLAVSVASGTTLDGVGRFAGGEIDVVLPAATFDTLVVEVLGATTGWAAPTFGARAIGVRLTTGSLLFADLVALLSCYSVVAPVAFSPLVCV